MRARWWLSMLVAGVGLIAPACGGGQARDAASSADEATSADASAAGSSTGGEVTKTGGSGAVTATDAAVQDAAADARELVRTGAMTVVAEDVRAAVGRAERAVTALGGFVYGQTDGSSGPDRATLTLKVPPDKFGQLLDDLGTVGKVERRSVDTADVTAEGADLDARIVSAQRSVERVRGFLDETKNVGELSSIEAELTRRETELEQLVGQRRVLNDRVAMATVTLTLNATPAPPPPAGDSLRSIPGFGDALASGVGALVKVGRVLGAGAGYALPFAVLLAVPLLAGRVVRRRRNATALAG